MKPRSGSRDEISLPDGCDHQNLGVMILRVPYQELMGQWYIICKLVFTKTDFTH